MNPTAALVIDQLHLRLAVPPPERDREGRVTLGRWSASNQPVHVVEAGWWQAAQPLGADTLVGCKVAPGFDFADFSFPDEQE